MGLETIEYPELPFALSAYTNEDSDGNAILKAHAYQAATDGFVFVYSQCDSGENVIIYVETTAQYAIDSDPTAGGVIVAYSEGAGLADARCFGNAAVAKGEYFEIVSTGAVGAIRWKSFGALSKPIDQD